MRIAQGTREVIVDTTNWPLVSDLLSKWGYKAKKQSTINVTNLDTICGEFCAWDIPWKRTSWE